MEQQHAAVFIDGAYMDKMQRMLGVLNIDMAAFSRWAANGYSMFRTYYYDCLPYQSGRPTLEESQRLSRKQRYFHALEQLDRFMVRQGRVEFRGLLENERPLFAQKRIDLQLGIDIGVLVGRNRVGCIVLVSGDSDMIPAVEVARTEGLIVRLIHGPVHTYRRDLWTKADERIEMTEAILSDLRRPTK